jgi:hypothetical protein
MGRSDPQDAARRLIADARRQGGPDNITAVVVRLETPEPAADRGGEDDTLSVPADEAVTQRGPALVPPSAAGVDPGAEAALAEAPPEAAGLATPAPPGTVDYTLVVPATAGATAAVAGEAAAEAPSPDADEEVTAELPVVGGAGGPADVSAPGRDGVAADAGAQAVPDPVPAVPEAPAQPLAAKRRRRGLWWMAGVLAVLVVLGSAGAFTLTTVYYVGVDDGRLAVFSGLPTTVGPVPLHAIYRRSSVSYRSLSPGERSLVDEEALRGKEEALALATALGMSP